MALKIDHQITPQALRPQLERLFELSGEKILSLQRAWKPERGTPVFTAQGRYTSRGWTEWTQGFQFGSALLQFDATDERAFLELGRASTVRFMAPHVSHIGVHDHGFNNISTYGHLLRLMREGRTPMNEAERDFYELALKVSGAVQAARWTPIAGGGGFVYSFNGPQSLFIDTMRSLRSLAVAHQLGHALLGEGDRRISLLRRLVTHADTTARFAVFYGEGRDAYDVRGRVAHESLFNPNDGAYRCPNSQQGYSPFTTWTRGLAWAMLGFAEQLEFFRHLDRVAPAATKAELAATADAPGFPANLVGRSCRSASTLRRRGTAALPPEDSWSEDGAAGNLAFPATSAAVQRLFLKAATATADFYLAHTPTDGVPYWDTGAPNLHRLGDYLNRPADPFNDWEPVDSSAGVVAAQGLIRLGNYLLARRQSRAGRAYRQAGLTLAGALFREPYLSTSTRHQGLLLHSVYHRPNGWDYVAPGARIPYGESSMWGDYHARELAVLLWREARSEPAPHFYLGAP